MKFTLEIELGNDAMQSGYDVGTAIMASLRESHIMLQGSAPIGIRDTGTIRDLSGNTVGKWEVTDASADPIERMYEEAFDQDDDRPAKRITELEAARDGFVSGWPDGTETPDPGGWAREYPEYAAELERLTREQ